MNISFHPFGRNLIIGLVEARQPLYTNQADVVKSIHGIKSYCHVKFGIKELTTKRMS